MASYFKINPCLIYCWGQVGWRNLHCTTTLHEKSEYSNILRRRSLAYHDRIYNQLISYFLLKMMSDANYCYSSQYFNVSAGSRKTEGWLGKMSKTCQFFENSLRPCSYLVLVWSDPKWTAIVQIWRHSVVVCSILAVFAQMCILPLCHMTQLWCCKS